MGGAPLKIAVDARELESNRTGIARFLGNLIEGSEDSPRPIRWLLLARASLHVPEGWRGRAEEILFRPGASSIAEDFFSFRALQRRVRWDLFFSPYYKLPRGIKGPSLATLHDLTPLTWGSFFYRRYFAYRAVDAVRRASGIVTVSETSRTLIAERFGLPPDAVTVVPNAAGSGFSTEDQADDNGRRRRMGLPDEGEGYLLYVGNALPHKNLPRLLEAYAGLGGDLQSRFPLVMTVGASALQKEIRGLGLEDRVIRLGSVGDEDLPALYRGARLFVFPSLAEGFGLPPLEAMASGVPTAVSNRPPLTEVAGSAGIFFDPLDRASITKALERGLADETERRQKALLGRIQAERYRREVVLAPFWETAVRLVEAGGMKARAQ